jgi:hypothetical protein
MCCIPIIPPWHANRIQMPNHQTEHIKQQGFEHAPRPWCAALLPCVLAAQRCACAACSQPAGLLPGPHGCQEAGTCSRDRAAASTNVIKRTPAAFNQRSQPTGLLQSPHGCQAAGTCSHDKTRRHTTKPKGEKHLPHCCRWPTTGRPAGSCCKWRHTRQCKSRSTNLLPKRHTAKAS